MINVNNRTTYNFNPPLQSTYYQVDGYGGKASGYASHVEGLGNAAQGSGSHAEGYYTQASGSYSHAEGYSTQALGGASHAEGYYTQASGYYSHAEGNSTQAIGGASHAEGSYTVARGAGSHAEGLYTVASGSYSHAEGYYTIASGSYQHVQGQYNLSSSAQSAFIHGNGTGPNTRSNLIFASGSEVQITGSLKVSGSITGSLFGTSSWAVSSSQAISASFAISSSRTVSSSYALTASVAPNYVLTSTTSSMTVLSSSYALTASVAPNYVLTSTTSSMTVLSSSFALTASYLSGYISAFPYTGSAQITGSLIVTGSTTSTEGFIKPGAGAQYLLADGTTTSGTGGSVFPYIGDAVITGSLQVTQGIKGPLAITGSTTVTGSLIVTGSTTSTQGFIKPGAGSQYLLADGTTTSGTGGSPFPYTGTAVITGSLIVSVDGITGAGENTLTLGPPPSGGTGEGGQILLAASGGLYTSASMFDNYQNKTRLLRGTNASSDAEVANWNMHTKQMVLPAYNSLSAFPGTAVASLAVDSGGNILTGDYPSSWTDYSATSTIVGWSAYQQRIIRYMTIGKLAHVEYFISGTSNSATTTFTLPFNAGSPNVTGSIQSNNNYSFASTTNNMGVASIPSGSNVVTCVYYSTAAAIGNWATTGAKVVRGTLTIEIP